MDRIEAYLALKPAPTPEGDRAQQAAIVSQLGGTSFAEVSAAVRLTGGVPAKCYAVARVQLRRRLWLERVKRLATAAAKTEAA